MARYERNLAKGLIAGLVGGLIGTFTMNEFQKAWSKLSEKVESGNGNKPEQQSQQQEQENAPMKAADKIARLGGRQLSYDDKKKFAPAVHYGFGTLQGGIYGGVTEMQGVAGGFVPALIFGASLFTAADEIALPTLGLSGKPTEYPLSSHLYGLAAHLIYGLSTEIARRGLRASL